jgi:hypothetical protein
MRVTVNQDGNVGRGNARRNPFLPFRTKTTMTQKVGKELPVDMVVSLFQVQLSNNTWISRS